MNFLLFVDVGSQDLLEAIRQVLMDPSFATGTPEAKEAREAAVSLCMWQEDERNQASDLRDSLSRVFIGGVNSSTNQE